MYRAIPTLDPLKHWNKDGSQDHIFITEKEIKMRTNKVEDYKVVVQATKEFPAQIAKLVKDVQGGRWETVYKSGKITPAQKSLLLSRIDSILDAIKQARAKANTVEVKPVKLGQSLLDIINEGIL